MPAHSNGDSVDEDDYSFRGEKQRLLSDDVIEADYVMAEVTTHPPPEEASGVPTNSDNQHVSSLDFERIVNEYSIQAVRDQWLLSLPPPPPPPSASYSSDHDNTVSTCAQRMSQRRDTEVDTPPAKPQLRHQKRRLFGYTGRTTTRWLLSAMAGLLTGLTSILIVETTSRIVTRRIQSMQHLIIDPEYSDAYVFGVFSLINLAGALSSSWLCVAWAPQAAGSGISQVKAYLNGVRWRKALTNPAVLFVVKVVGTILSVSSGLAIGMEGPLIYIGAVLGASCTKVSAFSSRHLARCKNRNSSCCRRRPSTTSTSETSATTRSMTQRWLSWTTRELSHFATDGERRDLVSIGASCGFAASFGAPIGGLLFILDDISSYFNRSLLLRMLVANTIGTFCLALQHGDLSDYSVINLGTYSTANYDIFFTRFAEVPLYIFIGIAGGIMGGIFCASFVWLRRSITGRLPPRGRGRGTWQLLEVAMLSLLTSVLLFYLPSMSLACKDRKDHAAVVLDTDFSEQVEQAKDFATEARPNRFFCPEGQVNELGNVLFGSRIEAIKRILTDPTDFKRETLLTVGILFYVLMTLTFGVALPSGIFTPSVLIGASLGGAAGITFQEWFGTAVAPSTFALLGVAALLAGIQRSTVSLCVILVEGTGQVKVLMPSIIVVVVARYAASFIHEKGIFEVVMAWKKLPYLDQKENKRRYDAIQVCEIMSDPPVVTVHPCERADDLADLLENSVHHGFPVVDPITNKFLGLVRRDQIAALLECGVFFSDVSDDGEQVPIPRRPTSYRPSPEVAKTPLMQWAYHINDDRYDYMLDASPPANAHKQAQVPSEHEPAPRHSVRLSGKLQSTQFTRLPTEFASIHRNDKNLIVVSWLNPVYSHCVVNLGAVMNRGAYCVPEYMPVSKAYRLFTALGLRHIVVLGGESGGEVVGVLSRINLLPEYIRERTGL